MHKANDLADSDSLAGRHSLEGEKQGLYGVPSYLSDLEVSEDLTPGLMPAVMLRVFLSGMLMDLHLDLLL